MNLPTMGQAAAFGRHVLTFAAGAVTFGAVTHIISGDQASSLTAAVTQIAHGLGELIAGVGTIVGIGSGLYAAWTASPVSQVKAVAALTDVGKIVAAPHLVAAVPSEKVVAP